MSKIFILYILFSSVTYAQSLLKCLGKEEAYYAKLKYTGPNYKLNQIMIEEIISLSDLKILPSAYRKICHNYRSYPSLLLLEELVKKNSAIFYSSMNATEKEVLKSFRVKVGKILLRYISQIQTLAKDPKCVERYIPETRILFSRYMYLEDVIDPSRVLGNEKELIKIIRKLRSSDKMLKQCEKPRRKK